MGDTDPSPFVLPVLNIVWSGLSHRTECGFVGAEQALPKTFQISLRMEEERAKKKGREGVSVCVLP